MKQTIEEVKKTLQTIQSLDELNAHMFMGDERKGVQNAITQRRNQLKKEQLLLKNYEEMSEFEAALLAQNNNAFICGIDEVGRGPLAGPVVTCAVI